MKLITSTEIENYINNNKRESESFFPELVKSLITNTVSNLTKIDIPSGDHIEQTGCDGIVEFIGKNKYLGNKPCRIEIGTSEDYLGKANKDIKKREPNKDENFVIFTPYRWNNRNNPKEKWCENKKKEFNWNDIIVIDGELFETWINEDILTAKRLLKKISNNNDFEIYSAKEIEEDYQRKTTKEIGLDFFDYNNEKYCEFFKNITSNHYNIVAPTKEEGLYVSLYTAMKVSLEEKIIVIKDEKTWNDIVFNNLINNAILIPYFFHEEGLSTPPNNITLFISDNSELKYNSDFIIENRSIDNLKKALNKYYDYDKTNEIVQKTLGRYYPLKRNLLKENRLPNWYKKYKEDRSKMYYLSIIFLLNNFTKKDLIIFEKLDISTQEIEYMLDSLSSESDPFLVKFDRREEYKIIDPMEVIEYLGNIIDDNLIKELYDIMFELLTFIPEKYLPENLNNNFFFTNLKNNKYSENVRSGILKSLILVRINKENNYTIISEIKEILEKYYNSIKSESDYRNFASLSDLLSEIDYKMFIDYINKSIKNNNFTCLFNLTNKDTLFSPNEYTNIIWGLEKAISKNDYISDAIDTLGNLCEIKEAEYKNMGNTPMNVLKKVFMGWDNLTCLDHKKKNELLVEFINKHYVIGRSLLVELFPKSNATWTHLSKPIYDTADTIKSIKYVSEQVSYFNDYYILYLKNYVKELADIIPIYEEEYFINFECADKIKEETIQLLNKSNSDDSKYKLYKIINRKIDGFKKFNNEVWNLNAKQVDYLNEIKSNIKFSNEAYKYIYLYTYDYRIINNNTSEKKDLISNLFSNEKRYSSTNILLEKCENKIDLIIDIYNIKHNKEHDINFIIMLFKSYNQYVNFYLKEVFKEEGESGIINIYDNITNVTDDEKVYVLTANGYNEKLYEKVKDTKYESLYWNKLDFIQSSLNDDIYGQLLKNKNYNMCLRFLSEEDSNFDKKIELLDDIKQNKNNIDGCDRYLINTIFESFDKVDNEELIDKIAKLEIYYDGILDHQTRYLSRIATKNPNIVVEISSIVYKTDKGNIFKISAPNKEAIVYNCYEKIENMNIDFSQNGLEWVKKFISGMKKRQRMKIAYNILGKLLSNDYKEDEEDKISPPKYIREIIEEYYNEELDESYRIALYNKRGVHYIGNGSEELELSEKYKKAANKIRNKYKRTSEILLKISKTYELEAKENREEANYV